MPNTPRVVTGVNQDTTGRTITQDYQAPAYASALTITTTAQNTTVNVGQLTGAVTVNVATTNPYIGDEIIFLFAADGTGSHIVTFGTGCVSTGTLTVAESKYGKATAHFNGTEWIVSSNATV